MSLHLLIEQKNVDIYRFIWSQERHCFLYKAKSSRCNISFLVNSNYGGLEIHAQRCDINACSVTHLFDFIPSIHLWRSILSIRTPNLISRPLQFRFFQHFRAESTGISQQGESLNIAKSAIYEWTCSCHTFIYFTHLHCPTISLLDIAIITSCNNCMAARDTTIL